MLIIITGLPGTGKTTVSEALASELNGVVLSTDKIRKTVIGESEYSDESKNRVYEEMFRIGTMLLRDGHHVIFDGTFPRKGLREKGYRVGRKAGRKVFFLETVLPGEIVEERIADRKNDDSGFSDADEHVYETMRKAFEPVERKHFTLDTSDEETWKDRLLDYTNEMRVLECRSDIVDRLKRAGDMKLIQTHISWILMNDTHVFKIKKPVNMSFVDYRTLDRRKYFCEREIQANSLLSPRLYQGVVSIRKKEGRVTIDENGGGEVIEYAVKMKRLPQKARMDRMLREKKVSRRNLEDIARILSDFHVKTAVAPSRYGSRRTIAENFAHPFETKQLVEEHLGEGKTVDTIQNHVEHFLEDRKDLFEERVRDERIRHCHGDVRTKNIFIHEGEVILFDAIEFSEKISCCDVAAEIGFLAMDLDFYRRQDLSEIFQQSYVEISGDGELRDLLTFYKCYRAMVQILVKSYILEDPDIGRTKKERARRECSRYLDLAESYSRDL